VELDAQVEDALDSGYCKPTDLRWIHCRIHTDIHRTHTRTHSGMH